MMTDSQLINKLRRMYRRAKRENLGEVNATLVLFGIMYADDLADSARSPEKIAYQVTRRSSPHIRIGMKLAKYVQIKRNVRI